MYESFARKRLTEKRIPRLRSLVRTHVLCAALVVTFVSTAEPPRIILDTDFRSDVDDAGSLALLNALADGGECQLIGVMASQTGPHVVAAINAINTWYGRGAVPIGLSPVDDQRFPDPYAPTIGDPTQYPSTQSNSTAPSSTALYRRLLHDAPDGSVRIVVVGGQTCIALLLASEPDAEGDGSIHRSGRDLIAAKVEGLYVMGGHFTDSEWLEHNIRLDNDAAKRVATEWPTPIVYSGFEIGRNVMTGGSLTEPALNPAAKAYELYPAGGVGVIANSSSYDQTIAYFAVRGAMAGDTRLWRLSDAGRVSFPESRTRFEPDTRGNARHLIAEAPLDRVAAAIETLMAQPPFQAAENR
jgi:hypothetical protein